jgi:putative membrane protein
MQSEHKKLWRFLGTWAINTLAVLVAVEIVPGIRFNDNHWFTPFVTSLVLGILNAFVRPILMFLALPLLIFTLGLFTLVINALLLYAVGQMPFFHVNSFGSAFLGALVISIVSIFLNIMTGGARVSIQRRPPKKKNDDDDKPVIDV